MPLQSNTKPQPTSPSPPRATDTPGQAELRRLYPQIRAQNPNADLNLMLNSVKNMTPEQVRVGARNKIAPPRHSISVPRRHPVDSIRQSLPLITQLPPASLQSNPKPGPTPPLRATVATATAPGKPKTLYQNHHPAPFTDADVSAYTHQFLTGEPRNAKSQPFLKLGELLNKPESDWNRLLEGYSAVGRRAIVAAARQTRKDNAQRYRDSERQVNDELDPLYKNIYPQEGDSLEAINLKALAFAASGDTGMAPPPPMTLPAIRFGQEQLSRVPQAIRARIPIAQAEPSIIGVPGLKLAEAQRSLQRQGGFTPTLLAGALDFLSPNNVAQLGLDFVPGGPILSTTDAVLSGIESAPDLLSLIKTDPGAAAAQAVLLGAGPVLHGARGKIAAMWQGTQSTAYSPKTKLPSNLLAQAAREAGISLEAARRIPVPSPITNPDAYRAAVLKRAAQAQPETLLDGAAFQRRETGERTGDAPGTETDIVITGPLLPNGDVSGYEWAESYKKFPQAGKPDSSEFSRFRIKDFATLKEAVRATFPHLTREQVHLSAVLAESVARGSAKQQGISTKEWYRQNLRGITYGGETLSQKYADDFNRIMTNVGLPEKADAVAQQMSGVTQWARKLGKEHSWFKPMRVDDARQIIVSLMRRDVSTLPHELSHLFQRQLKGEDADILNRWVGAEDGRWMPKHDERFALAYERWLQTEQAPHPSLKRVFPGFAFG